MTMTPQPVWKLDALLGEGPVWLEREQAIRFVDIKRGLLHCFDVKTKVGETLNVGGNPSFIVPDTDGGLVVGANHGLYHLEGEVLGRCIATIPQPTHNRTNDATVDVLGRLWFGTMDDEEQQSTGAVWCLDKGVLHPTDVSAVVTNGPAISTDGRFLYHVDSGARTIWRFPLGAEPQLTGGEVFIQLSESDGHPDGVVVDSEDCLWVALWDGWGVRRYAPDGRLLAHVALPCARVTKLAFGGTDLKTAYVTTARVGLSDTELAEQPLAGSLFAFDAPAAGRILPPVRLAN